MPKSCTPNWVPTTQISYVRILFFNSGSAFLPCPLSHGTPYSHIVLSFAAFIIQAYGGVLAPLPGATKSFGETSSLQDLDQGNLSRALGSVVGIASLRAEGGVGPQLVSHTYGLLKARNTENQSEEDKWLSSDEGTEWVLRTVDEILDGVSTGEQGPSKAKL